MTDEKLLLYLNWFYALEVGQVDLYLTQARRSKDQYIAFVLLQVAEIEKRHAVVFRDYMRKLGAEPSKVGAELSHLSGVLARASSYTGTVNMFFLNYLLESIAIRDYRALIKKIDPSIKGRQELINILVENLVEEDLHRSWFESRRESLQRMGKKLKREKQKK